LLFPAAQDVRSERLLVKDNSRPAQAPVPACQKGQHMHSAGPWMKEGQWIAAVPTFQYNLLD
jgi:hypothetical protein